MNSPKPPTGKRPQFTGKEVLLFHSEGRPGRIEIAASKPLAVSFQRHGLQGPPHALP